VVTPAQLGIVTFALRGADHAAHTRAPTGSAARATPPSPPRGSRGSVLRLCTINPRTGEDDIATTLERLGSDQTD
jgi:hypothetical protein